MRYNFQGQKTTNNLCQDRQNIMLAVRPLPDSAQPTFFTGIYQQF